MKTKNKKAVAEALAFYRCPHCEGNAKFRVKELSVTDWDYDFRKGRFQVAGWQPVGDYGYSSEEVGDFWSQPSTLALCGHNAPLDTVLCGHCEQPVLWHDHVVPGDDMQEWLEDVARRWEAQVAERTALVKRLAKLEAGFPQVGECEPIRERIKQLETIS
jgi:hypothetical protein